MKRILITGESSFVGKSIKNWLNSFPSMYIANSISLRSNTWMETDLSIYDVVIHAAGLAHIKETKENARLYYEINRDLANKVAMKAKMEGVGQFIFISSMSVYGIEKGVITENTLPNPKSNYGKSKLEAEKMLEDLSDDSYKVAILRPPMIYGKGCKGNYQKLARLAVRTPFFPDIKNQRSMIYIDNFCEFIRLLIDHNRNGLYFPQNKEFVCTSNMVLKIAQIHEKKIYMVKLLNPLLKVLDINLINKVFGDLVYEKSLSKYDGYDPISLEETIEMTEDSYRKKL